MKSYNIKIIDSAPDWDSIDTLCIDVPYQDTPGDITAHAQICCNENEFLLHLTTCEKNFIKEQTGSFGRPCLDSCLEFFFCPMENDNRYFNIEFNPNCCVYCGLGTSMADLIRFIPEQDTNEIFTPIVKTTTDGWEIFYKIPFNFIRRIFPDFKVYEGKKIRANCFKCADNSNPPHYLSWSKVDEQHFTFHNQERFGVMNFIK